jgi:hypothetical protein
MTMSQLMAMMYALIDDVNKSEELSEIWHQSLPQVSLRGLDASRYLDGLEERVTEDCTASGRANSTTHWHY